MTIVYNVGSINIDYVYQVPHFVQPGETLLSGSLQTVLGGKGANQSIALARAGIAVQHIGRLNKADEWAHALLLENSVGADHIELCDEPSGHAIIQVDTQGENAIVLHGGANQGFIKAKVRSALEKASVGDYLLLQNECNLIEQIFELGQAKGLRIVLNPAPMTQAINHLPLAQLDTLVVNQIEAQMISELDDIDAAMNALSARLPNTRVVITLGSKGAISAYQGERFAANASTLEVVDTTGAGDTFVGYLLAGLINGLGEQAALNQACQAGSLAVTRAGAIPSIPWLADLHV